MSTVNGEGLRPNELAKVMADRSYDHKVHRDIALLACC